VGVFATVVDDAGRVLLGHRRDCDFWGQPGGGWESGETPWAGVVREVREVREETGLAVVVERLVGVYGWPATDELIFSFVCRVAGGTLATSDETSAVHFFAPEALPANTFAEHIERICDALAPAPGPYLRVPSGPSAGEEARAADADRI
jgi:ADP-ribose pyrophosphatase YjhB (NUDIX family)